MLKLDADAKRRVKDRGYVTERTRVISLSQCDAVILHQGGLRLDGRNMSSGPPVPIIPQVTSAQEYQFNKKRLEKARKLLEMYDSMNEDAFRKHREEELAQKIAEGEKARSVSLL